MDELTPRRLGPPVPVNPAVRATSVLALLSPAYLGWSFPVAVTFIALVRVPTSINLPQPPNAIAMFQRKLEAAGAPPEILNWRLWYAVVCKWCPLINTATLSNKYSPSFRPHGRIARY